MKTDVTVVSSRGKKMDDALIQADKVAAYKNLSHKSALHLRLLTEEAMGMLRSIAGDVEGKFWIEDDGDVYELHLQVKTDTDEQQRKQLISASTSGKNEATRGLMGKIRAFFEPVDGLPVFFDTYPDGMFPDAPWSMREYEQQLRVYLKEKRDGAADAWDELEKSVISHVADDVKVSIRGRQVEMVIVKKMV